MKRQSHLGRALGLGSTNDGVSTWWAERLPAIALVPLTLWFIYSAVGLAGADYQTVRGWVGQDGNPVLLILFIYSMFQHGQMGLKVVLEDYVGGERNKLIAIVLAKFVAALFGLSSIFAVLRLTFGS